MEKLCKKYTWKASHCMQEILLKIRYFERGLSKSLEKGQSNWDLLMDKIMKKGSVNSD